MTDLEKFLKECELMTDLEKFLRACEFRLKQRAAHSDNAFNGVMLDKDYPKLLEIIKAQNDISQKLQKQNEMLKAIVIRTVKIPCDPVDNLNCLACDAKQTLEELESDEEK